MPYWRLEKNRRTICSATPKSMQTEAVEVISAGFSSSRVNRHSAGSPICLTHRASNKKQEIQTRLLWFDSGLTQAHTHARTHGFKLHNSLYARVCAH